MGRPHLPERRGIEHCWSRSSGLLIAYKVHHQGLAKQLLATDCLGSFDAISQPFLERSFELPIRNETQSIKTIAIPWSSTLDSFVPAHRTTFFPRSSGQLSVVGRDKVERQSNLEKVCAIDVFWERCRFRPHQLPDSLFEFSVRGVPIILRGNISLGKARYSTVPCLKGMRLQRCAVRVRHIPKLEKNL